MFFKKKKNKSTVPSMEELNKLTKRVNSSISELDTVTSRMLKINEKQLQTLRR